MKVIVVALLISSFLSLKTEAAPELLDSVSVIVDQGVVLQSQIDELITVVKYSSPHLIMNLWIRIKVYIN